MSNVIYSDEYLVLQRLLAAERQRAGVTQCALAKRMHRSKTHIHKIETRQRRVELLEFYRYIVALGGDPVAVFERFVSDLESEDQPAG